MKNKKLYVVKNNKGWYWCGYNQWSTQLRHSKVYISPKYAQETIDRFKEDSPFVVEVEMAEAEQGCNINPKDDEFGLILNCAVRYAIGRQTYMPHAVMDYIRPLLPHLTGRTLGVMISDIEKSGSYGDDIIDKPNWMRFLVECRAEMEKRGAENG
jgi:hypothetical protein